MAEHCFVHCDEDVFRLVKIVRREGDEVVVEYNGVESKYKKSDIGVVSEEELAELDASPPRIADLIHLTTVSQETILYTLRRRYDHDLIYTSIGSILIAVNPFKNMGPELYSERMIMNYFNNDANPAKHIDGSVSAGNYTLEETPHVYACSQRALEGISAPSGENQSLIISGESGAGKTEATKHCLHYLAHTSGSTGGSDAHIRLQTASPVLEAWGNAKTLRNNNSSRFGKFTEIWLNNTGKLHANLTPQYAIDGASITTYLLEKTRVVTQAKNERNYHVFYQLLAGLAAGNSGTGGGSSAEGSSATISTSGSSSRRRGSAASLSAADLPSAQNTKISPKDRKQQLNRWALSTFVSDPSSCMFLNQSGCFHVDGIVDQSDYDEMQQSMAVLGFSSEHQVLLSQILAGVLHCAWIVVIFRVSVYTTIIVFINEWFM